MSPALEAGAAQGLGQERVASTARGEHASSVRGEPVEPPLGTEPSSAVPPPLGHQRQHLTVCASTNDEAARLARAGAPHGVVVTADAQTAGRGRLGRVWHSPPGESLYLSVLLRPPIAPLRAPVLTLAAGAALAQAVTDLFIRTSGLRCPADGAPEAALKWPNDLLIYDVEGAPRKAAGILTELTCRGSAIDFLVVGIGVNLNALRFPPELAGRATSLRLALGGGPLVDGEALLDAILRRLDALYRRFLREGAAPVLAAFQTHAAFLRRGEALTVHSGDEVLRGVPLGLAEDGALLLRDEAGVTRRIVAGELS